MHPRRQGEEITQNPLPRLIHLNSRGMRCIPLGNRIHRPLSIRYPVDHMGAAQLETGVLERRTEVYIVHVGKNETTTTGGTCGKEQSFRQLFVSFDYDNDARLKDLLVGQSKNADSPFELADWSIKEHLTGDWKEKARKRIRAVDIVCVLCGEKTHTATGVAAELELAQEEKKEYFLLKGYADKTCTKPTTANANDKMYNWTWDKLKTLVGGGR